MLIDVRPILHIPGTRLDFQFQLDLSDLDFNGRNPVKEPVAVSGFIRNSADVLNLELTANSLLDAVCDRCGKEFRQDKTVLYSCVLAEEVQNEDNDEIVVLEDGKVAEYGTHEELLKNDGLYKSLFEKQQLEKQLREEGREA